MNKFPLILVALIFLAFHSSRITPMEPSVKKARYAALPFSPSIPSSLVTLSADCLITTALYSPNNESKDSARQKLFSVISMNGYDSLLFKRFLSFMKKEKTTSLNPTASHKLCLELFSSSLKTIDQSLTTAECCANSNLYKSLKDHRSDLVSLMALGERELYSDSSTAPIFTAETLNLKKEWDTALTNLRKEFRNNETNAQGIMNALFTDNLNIFDHIKPLIFGKENKWKCSEEQQKLSLKIFQSIKGSAFQGALSQINLAETLSLLTEQPLNALNLNEVREITEIILQCSASNPLTHTFKTPANETSCFHPLFYWQSALNETTNLIDFIESLSTLTTLLLKQPFMSNSNTQLSQHAIATILNRKDAYTLTPLDYALSLYETYNYTMEARHKTMALIKFLLDNGAYSLSAEKKLKYFKSNPHVILPTPINIPSSLTTQISEALSQIEINRILYSNDEKQKK